MVSLYLSRLWGCALDQPVRQASALAYEGSICRHIRGRKKERKKERKEKKRRERINQ